MRLSLAIAAFATGCAGHAMPCADPSCESGMECLANRCVRAGSDPVPATTERRVLEAISVATERADSLGPSVRVGGKRSGAAKAVYLGFDVHPERHERVVAAFLLLQPLP